MVTPADKPIAAKAACQLERIKRTLTALDIHFMDLRRDVLGAGVGVVSDDKEFIVLSVSGPANGVLNITAGVLKDVSHDRPLLLELCNHLTRDNSACAVYLHDAPDGWDIHVQQRYLINLLEAVPWFLMSCVQNLPAVTKKIRSRFREAGIGGDQYASNASDAQRLLIRSIL